MGYFETHDFPNIEEQKLYINLTVKSQTDNRGTKEISIPLFLQSNVTSLIGG